MAVEVPPTPEGLHIRDLRIKVHGHEHLGHEEHLDGVWGRKGEEEEEEEEECGGGYGGGIWRRKGIARELRKCCG